MAVPGAILDPTCEGTLTIGGVNLNNAAICVSGLYELYGARVDYRGSDRILPYAQGTLQYPRWRVATRHSLPLLITGHVDTNGVEAMNVASMLATHLRSLITCSEPPDPTTGNITRAAVLILPNGTTLTGDVIPLGITTGDVQAGIMKATFDLSIPAGRLV
jgi:hypothetical protein